MCAVVTLLRAMAVGRRPYALEGELASLQRIVDVDAPRPSKYEPQYPVELEHIVIRALARDPRQRRSSCCLLVLAMAAAWLVLFLRS